MSLLQAIKEREINEVDRLIQTVGAAINDTHGDLKETLLHVAASTGVESIVAAVLKAKPNVNAKDLHGRTPLFNAAFVGSEAIVDLLLNNFNKASPKCSCTCCGCSALEKAAELGHEAVVTKLLLQPEILNPKYQETREKARALATKNGHVHLTRLIGNPNTVKVLVKPSQSLCKWVSY